MIEEPNLFTKRVTSFTFGKSPEKIGLNRKRLLPLRGWDSVIKLQLKLWKEKD